MSNPLRGNVKMALASVRSARWRSALTMLGIVIAVTSVITAVGIGEGVKRQVTGQIDQLGRDLITVRPGGQPDVGLGGFLGQAGAGQLDERDIAAVAGAAGVGQAVPFSLLQGEVRAGERALSRPVILGTTPELDRILHRPVEHGTFFTETSIRDEPNAAIIGPDVARELFGQRIPIGRSFDFLGANFIVQGVLRRTDSSPLAATTDYNRSIFIPYTTAQALTAGNAPLLQILARPQDPARLSATVDSITASLEATHKGQQQFAVLRQEQSLALADGVMDLLTMLVVGIAALALLVGGIGIMNVMLVSVAERRHEIGIRKALGATNRQIALQFMVEAVVLSVIGAVLGVLLALLLNFIIRITTDIVPVFEWRAALLASAVALAVGVLFGTAPAVKAARKDPIDALRNE